MPTKEAMGRMLARMLGRTASRIAPAATPPSAAPALARLAGLRSGGVLPAAPPSAAPVGTALSGLGRGGLGGPPPAASLVIPPMPPPMPPPPAPSPSAAATTPGLLSKLHEYVRGQAHLSPGQSFRQYPISATYNAMTNPATAGGISVKLAVLCKVCNHGFCPQPFNRVPAWKDHDHRPKCLQDSSPGPVGCSCAAGCDV